MFTDALRYINFYMKIVIMKIVKKIFGAKKRPEWAGQGRGQRSAGAQNLLNLVVCKFVPL